MSHLTELLATLDGVGLEDFKGNDIERLRLIGTVKKLLGRVETQERLFDIVFGQPVVFAAMETLLDLGLWKKWAAIDGASKSVDELCQLCTQECDPNLLRRLLRLLASVHVIAESSQDHYELTSTSRGYMWEWIPSRRHHWGEASLNLPLFLAKTGYKNPQDTKITNYTDFCPGNLDFFGKCTADPAYQDSFSAFMKGWARYKVSWPTFYDTSSLVNGADLSNGGVLCVDTGGHHGIDLTRLLNKHPDIPAGSLVLQDLPEVVKGATDLSLKIKVMPHDMFQPQPVKGSRSYYFHAVFHDWPDGVAIQILKNTAKAMTKGYSRLLIVDIVVPVTGASAIQSAMDVEMMALLSSHERTEAMWTKLISDAGLKLIKIWHDGRGNEGLVEAELA
ncbi:putative O-methyltransferase [Xylaria digitata]|nr:putative O-methyltransferase [Xylaria digitata]